MTKNSKAPVRKLSVIIIQHYGKWRFAECKPPKTLDNRFVECHTRQRTLGLASIDKGSFAECNLLGTRQQFFKQTKKKKTSPALLSSRSPWPGRGRATAPGPESPSRHLRSGLRRLHLHSGPRRLHLQPGPTPPLLPARGRGCRRRRHAADAARCQDEGVVASPRPSPSRRPAAQPDAC